MPGARHARKDTRPDSMHPINRIYIPVHSIYFCAIFPSFRKAKRRSFAKELAQK